MRVGFDLRALQCHSRFRGIGRYVAMVLKKISEIDKDNTVVGFKEKPWLDIWVNIGYFILKRDILKYLNNFTKFEDFLHYCGENNLLKAYKHEGEHYTVNTIVELDLVEKNIHKITN